MLGASEGAQHFSIYY